MIFESRGGFWGFEDLDEVENDVSQSVDLLGGAEELDVLIHDPHRRHEVE